MKGANKLRSTTKDVIQDRHIRNYRQDFDDPIETNGDKNILNLCDDSWKVLLDKQAKALQCETERDEGSHYR